eukprot:TRINITY_DN4559_c0_g1_i6.p1 TRINITY_DN4559_c0_g1~~TRINITY_DN4559_c0_g1_i6.p1  ORF type:complete len:173 (-),score=38.75 TRINITY_DN4559_c0_g1_i6:902-1420(-)
MIIEGGKNMYLSRVLDYSIFGKYNKYDGKQKATHQGWELSLHLREVLLSMEVTSLVVFLLTFTISSSTPPLQIFFFESSGINAEYFFFFFFFFFFLMIIEGGKNMYLSRVLDYSIFGKYNKYDGKQKATHQGWELSLHLREVLLSMEVTSLVVFLLTFTISSSTPPLQIFFF